MTNDELKPQGEPLDEKGVCPRAPLHCYHRVVITEPGPPTTYGYRGICCFCGRAQEHGPYVKLI